MSILLVSIVVLFIVDIIRERGLKIDEFLLKENILSRWIFLIVIIVSVFVYGKYGLGFDAKQFIYFQF